VIEVHLDLGGYPVTLLDTAGIRETKDPVEQEGVRRARDRARAADLVLWVVDGSGGPAADEARPLADADQQAAESAPVWPVLNKIDLLPRDAIPRTEQGFGLGDAYAVSALSGQGLDRLTEEIAAFAGKALGAGEPALVTRERQRHALAAALETLRRAEKHAGPGKEDVFAEELRAATTALGRLIGRVDVEDILDVVFRDFCIGK
jgi:tRNA modification GTPase